MGIDTSHDCWHGAYSAFMRWRQEIARAAGIPLMIMEGFYDAPDGALIRRTQPRANAMRPSGGGMTITREMLSESLTDAAERGDAGRWEAWSSKWRDSLPIKWQSLKPDPIHTLLNHSDCEGSIAAADCGPLADALEKLIPLLPTEPGWGHVENWKHTTRRFVDGLRAAAKASEDVKFY